MSEPFAFDVVSRRVLTSATTLIVDQQAYSTTFEQIERLRELMLSFLQSQRRDYQPSFDVLVVGE